MKEKIHIPEAITHQIIEHATNKYPEEACGMIAGKGDYAIEFIPITNELHSPSRFRMDAVEQLNAFLDMEEHGLELIAISHSHPDGPDHPSQTDLDEFNYPGTFYVICYLQKDIWEIKAFLLTSQEYSQITIIS